MRMDIGSEYIADVAARLKGLRQTAERAIAQVDERGFFATPDPETNSIAINLKHVGGNLRSRFTDFLTTDGEKPDRDRDGEFIITEADTRAAVEAEWARGWDVLESTLASLTADDLLKTIQVRGESMTALSGLNRAVAHLAGHVGQITLLAKHYAGADWQTLTIPRGQSKTFQP
jgi:hypothetical protein